MAIGSDAAVGDKKRAGRNLARIGEDARHLNIGAADNRHNAGDAGQQVSEAHGSLSAVCAATCGQSLR